MKVFNRLVVSLILKGITFYRKSWIHRWTHRNGCPCIFIPTCTEYTARAVVKYGPWRGLKMGYNRIQRCKPSHVLQANIDFP